MIVGIAGAALWGAITLLTNYQIAYMAVGIGVGVGFVIRKFGNGVQQLFGYMGAGIALFSVVLGNFLSIIGFIANSEELGYFDTLLLFDYSYLPVLMTETFSVIDLIFYGLALYTGYKFSFRLMTEQTAVELNTK
ncbi:MAG: hypothetical protein U5K79_00240 [Cyclobacteriaceae bacterium]|nr:hypothetical protein [Cyclobacteriaceae bacterium]